MKKFYVSGKKKRRQLIPQTANSTDSNVCTHASMCDALSYNQKSEQNTTNLHISLLFTRSQDSIYTKFPIGYSANFLDNTGLYSRAESLSVHSDILEVQIFMLRATEYTWLHFAVKSSHLFMG